MVEVFPIQFIQFWADGTVFRQGLWLLESSISRYTNLRFVVTNLGQPDRYLYDRMYCSWGDMEKRIEGNAIGKLAKSRG